MILRRPLYLNFGLMLSPWQRKWAMIASLYEHASGKSLKTGVVWKGQKGAVFQSSPVARNLRDEVAEIAASQKRRDSHRALGHRVATLVRSRNARRDQSVPCNHPTNLGNRTVNDAVAPGRLTAFLMSKPGAYLKLYGNGAWWCDPRDYSGFGLKPQRPTPKSYQMARYSRMTSLCDTSCREPLATTRPFSIITQWSVMANTIGTFCSTTIIAIFSLRLIWTRISAI
jgi:hypothetical protein